MGLLVYTANVEKKAKKIKIRYSNLSIPQFKNGPEHFKKEIGQCYRNESRTYITRDVQPNCLYIRCLQGESQTMNQNTKQMHNGRASLNLWSAECQGNRQRQHRTELIGHTPSVMIEVKISQPVGNRIRTAGLEGRDSTDRVMV